MTCLSTQEVDARYVERISRWCHLNDDNVNLSKIETPMDPHLAEEIYLLDRCVECGCCVASCGNFRMRPDFVGAVAINKISRFRLDPRDHRNDADYYEILGTESGVFGCMSLLACPTSARKICLPETQIAFMRRKMAEQGIMGKEEPASRELFPLRELKLD